MEVKAELNKPYTEDEKINFIVEYNHKLGFEIQETETKLQALGYSQEEIDEQEKTRINSLSCTKRVFALMLQELGVSYASLKELISSNEQAQLEWDLCVELKRSNPLLDTMAQSLNITPQMLDRMFKYANGLTESLTEAV